MMSFAVIESISYSKCSKTDVKEILLETSSGILSGSCEFIEIKSHQGKVDASSNVYSWLSVPYAEPPIGNNRFKAPIEVSAKGNIVNATKWPNSCFQSTIIRDEPEIENFPGYKMWQIKDSSKISEDCLYLNIFVPNEAYNQNSAPQYENYEPETYPILVFFHDGIFKNGSSSLNVYNPSVFVAATKIIVITVNYRSGIFGFLFLEDHFAGNQGLLDQNLALKWIKKNSKKFGGDANRITLLGQGAGASFTGYHLFYNDSWDYFRNMILQSGTPLIDSLSPISKEEANKRAKNFVSSIGCLNEKTSFDRISCVQKAQVESILQATSGYLPFIPTNFLPVIDQIILSETPLNYLKSGNFKKCPLITGFTTDEGSFFAGFSGLIKNIFNHQSISHIDLISYLDKHFPFYPKFAQKSKQLALNAILHEYTRMVSETDDDGILNFLAKPSYFAMLNKIIGDFIFKCPTYKFVNLMAKNNNQVYLYLFAHRISSTPWPSWYGATHGDDLAFLFSYPLATNTNGAFESENPWSKNTHRYSENEKKLNEEILKYWSSFVYNSDPNLANSARIWPKYSLLNYDSDIGNMTDPSEAGRYIILRSSGSKVGRGYSLESCQFWNSYLPSLVKESGKFLKA
ncbi:acetylcholinesterase [Brachionus plicatilis]|uniref:Acetylcholinesterase n=1 Tax=Brachionus plicatilis TaxID=10195 RepID=A0A3M7S0P1_BRAPC|nr:acetylcholinesterase [Brachionus plicatilis]